jgi:hypothetical protein
MARVTVYNRSDRRVRIATTGYDYREGDTFYFTSHHSRGCEYCHHGIASDVEHLVARRGGGVNSHFHSDCVPGWLIESVIQLMEA